MVYIITTNNYELRQQIYNLGYSDETMDLEEEQSALVVNGQEFSDTYLSNLGDEEELSEEYEDDVEVFNEDEINEFLETINVLD